MKIHRGDLTNLGVMVSRPRHKAWWFFKPDQDKNVNELKTIRVVKQSDKDKVKLIEREKGIVEL